MNRHSFNNYLVFRMYEALWKEGIHESSPQEYWHAYILMEEVCKKQAFLLDSDTCDSESKIV